MRFRNTVPSSIGLLLCLTGVGCGRGPTTGEPEPDEVIAVFGALMGQSPPGLTPQRFGPPEILASRNWFWHSSPTFSPDGLQMYWAKYVPPSGIELAYSESTAGGWSLPRAPSFAAGGGENQPRFSTDGNSLFYISASSPGHILRVTRS